MHELDDRLPRRASPTSASRPSGASTWPPTSPLPLGELGARFGVSKQRMGQIADQLKKRFRAEIVAKLGPDVRTDWLGAESE